MRSLLMTVLSNNRQSLRLIFGFNHHPVPVPPASFISLTFMPKPVLWYFLDSRKYRPPVPPFSPAYALCCFSMPSLSAISAMNSPLVGLSSGMATRQPNARFSDSTRPRLQATSMAWRMARSTLLGLVA